MMKNFIHTGDVVAVPAPAGGALSGDAVLVGALFGVAACAAPEGAQVEILTEGVFDLAKEPGDAWSLGDKAYWDTAARRATRTPVGGAWIGVAIDVASASSLTVRVRLNHQPI